MSDEPSADAFRNCFQLPTADVRILKILIQAAYTDTLKRSDGTKHTLLDLIKVLKLADDLDMASVKIDVFDAIAASKMDTDSEIWQVLQLSEATWTTLRSIVMQIEHRATLRASAVK
jgi:hypothetical protein